MKLFQLAKDNWSQIKRNCLSIIILLIATLLLAAIYYTHSIVINVLLVIISLLLVFASLVVNSGKERAARNRQIYRPVTTYLLRLVLCWLFSVLFLLSYMAYGPHTDTYSDTKIVYQKSDDGVNVTATYNSITISKGDKSETVSTTDKYGHDIAKIVDKGYKSGTIVKITKQIHYKSQKFLNIFGNYKSQQAIYTIYRNADNTDAKDVQDVYENLTTDN